MTRQRRWGKRGAAYDTEGWAKGVKLAMRVIWNDAARERVRSYYEAYAAMPSDLSASLRSTAPSPVSEAPQPGSHVEPLHAQNHL